MSTEGRPTAEAETSLMRMREHEYFVYILTNAGDSVLYIGMTNNLTRRIEEHRRGLIDGFTKKYACAKLIYFETTSQVWDAIEREKQLKRWSRGKKERLIEVTNPLWADLSFLL